MLECYHSELLNFLTRQLDDPHTAADLTQECFARVLAAQDRGQSIVDVRALLYHAARNLVVDQFRRNTLRHHEALETLPDTLQPVAPRQHQPEEALASRQVVRNYTEVIEALPPRCREAFVLHVFEEMSQAQVALQMGISVSMVEKHIVRGMQACKLQRALSESASRPAHPCLTHP